MYNIAYTEPFNAVIHGCTEKSSKDIHRYHLVMEVYEAGEFFENYELRSNLDIVEMVELPGSECVAIFKTFWLRILQRKWKKDFALVKVMKRLRHLRFREVRGAGMLKC